jgi:hypothetical protein
LLEGSCRVGGFSRLRQTYGATFDVCNSDIVNPYFAAHQGPAALSRDPVTNPNDPPAARLADDPTPWSPDDLAKWDPEVRWVSGGGDGRGYRAGDVVLFHKYCIHGSTMNTTTDGVR